MGSKVAEAVCCLLFRILVPLVLVVAAVVRYNALSFIYTVFLLLYPLLNRPTSVTIRGSVGVYLRVVFIVGLLAVLAHAVFHITLTAIATDQKPYGSMFPNCSQNERIARQLGVERLDGVPIVDVIRLVLPDVAVFLTTLIVYIICYKLLPAEKNASQQDLPTTVKSQKRRTVTFIVHFIGEGLLVLCLAASGIIAPSVLSSVYFITFIFLATLWSLYGYLGRKFAACRILLMIYTAGHILLLHLYQFQFFQKYLPPDDFVARLLGLTAVVYTDCSKPFSIFFYDTSKWQNFVNPGILLCLYYMLTIEVRKHCSGQASEGYDHLDGNGQVIVAFDEADGNLAGKRKHRRRQKSSERQVAANLDESLKEHLVEAEVRDYSSIEQPVPSSAGREGAAFDRSGSPTMLTSDDELDGADPSDSPSRKKRRSAANEKRRTWVSAFVFLMRQSYVLSLIAMMAWSITFHSWLTFVLLLSACIIWMTSNSRRVILVLSPFILLYGICLLAIQFVYGMDLDAELPDESNGIRLADVGFKKFRYPCPNLALQVLYTSMFWLMLRQYMRERRLASLGQQERYQMEEVPQSPVPSINSPMSLSDILHFPPGLDSADGYDSSTTIFLGQYVWGLLCKYWILVCCAMMLVISLQEVVVYRIIYMILFLLFVLTFHLFYRVWRVTMYLFWCTIIVYSMIVLIMLYVYQFENIEHAIRNSTGLDEKTLVDIGLQHFDTAGLFVRLLTPTLFLIFIIIQVHYFHTPFLHLSDLERFKNTEDPAPVTPILPSPEANTDTDCSSTKNVSSFSALFKRFWTVASDLWMNVTWFLWRLAEIHMFKVVAFVVIMVATHEVSAVSAVYVLLLSVFLPLTGIHFLFSHIAICWTAVVIIAKMIYQLDLVDNSLWMSNCTGNISQEYPFNQQIDNAAWVGMQQTEPIIYYLRNYIGILLIIIFERMVKYHQIQYFNRPNVVKPRQGIIFVDIKRAQADLGVVSCVKYFLNYFFYKFGLEMCYIMSAITICLRVDVLSMIYAVCLGLLLLISRRGNARIWPIYTIFLVILLAVQFLFALGLPLFLCYEYIWDARSWMLKDNQGTELEQWLYLPDYVHGPNPFKLIADFFQLLFVSLQWRVFRIEGASRDQEPDGGTNEDITPDVEAKTPIPVEDFTTKITSYLDVIKNFVFMYMFWVTLAIVFYASTTRINLFSIVYVILVFYFMWFGQEFLIKPLRKLVRGWNFLLGYCFLVILLKAALQLPGCVYIKTIEDKACWLIQLLGLTCLRPGYIKSVGSCVVEDDNTGLSWDVVCFTFLLLQRRIYTSHYFRHVVADIEAQNRLASRGCQLINRILMRSVAKQKAEEKEILYKIKNKMKKLKEKQTSLKKNYVEPEEHFQAIRSGDYYLFEDSDEEEEDDEINTITFGQDRDKSKDGERPPSPMELISTAVTSGTDEAVKRAEESEDESSSKPSSPHPDQTGSGTDVDPACDTEQKPDEQEEKEEGIFMKVKNVFKFVLALLISCANWLTSLFNRISRNYRLVAAKMKDDHIRIKQQIHSEQRLLASSPIELKDTSEHENQPTTSQQEGDTGDLIEVSAVEPDPQPPKQMDSELSLSAVDLDQFDEDEEEFDKSQPCLYKLLVATYFAIVARSELVCFMLMIINHVVFASLLSLPLPLFVFLWGMLSVPRPTKTFWITVITYTEAVVVVKYVFQFGFFSWNNKADINDPAWPPKIIGIEQKDSFAVMDLVLLLALFIHRTILKRFGLWKDEEENLPSKSSSATSIEGAGADVPALEGIKHSDSRTSSLAVEPSVTGAAMTAATTSDSGNQLSSSLEQAGGECEESGEEPKQDKPSPFRAIVSPFVNFYKQLTCPDFNATTDVYAPMFACDFINFLIIMFGYQAFGPSKTTGAGDVTSYISENRIPVPFLVMLLAQFVMIIIDRALYLRKNVFGKFIFQILLVVCLHIWLFFVLPFYTGKPFANNKLVQVWYLIKCIYFALSAYQIRSAYPTRILGNFLTKKYNYVNLYLFKGFLAIPFLLELRTLMDWIWTNTTMAVGSWLQMEDIYANIYILKCNRVIEQKYPTPRAIPKRALIKYGVGGLLLFIIIFIIWFPLVIFSFANTVFEPNPPRECKVSVVLAGYQPLFEASGQQQAIRTYTPSEYKELKGNHDTNAAASGFLSNYEAQDVTLIRLDGKSTSVWTISPPNMNQLIDDLRNDNITMNMEFHVSFTREPNSQAGELLSQQYRHKLSKKERHETSDMILGKTNKSVLIAKVFPEFIRLGTKEASPVTALLGPQDSGYNGVYIYLNSTQSNSSQAEESWWQIKASLNDDWIIFRTFNDRVAPAGFSIITGYGIIGLYVTFILLIGRMLRMGFTGLAAGISFRELPNVDNVLRLCLDLYLVREMQEFRLEEDLYAKLVFVYRSAETRVKWTRLKMQQIVDMKKQL